MDPISISIEIELGTLLLAGVGALYTWFQHRQKRNRHRQREAHHRQKLAMHERHYQDAKACELAKGECPTPEALP